jgi:hypothetical protein
VNAVPEPLPTEENEAPIDHFEGRILYCLSTNEMNNNAIKFFNYEHEKHEMSLMSYV